MPTRRAPSSPSSYWRRSLIPLTELPTHDRRDGRLICDQQVELKSRLNDQLILDLQFATVAPSVPEPSTWAMMILGFAALASWHIAGSQSHH
jgi:PEP-CTERM motif